MIGRVFIWAQEIKKKAAYRLNLEGKLIWCLSLLVTTLPVLALRPEQCVSFPFLSQVIIFQLSYMLSNHLKFPVQTELQFVFAVKEAKVKQLTHGALPFQTIFFYKQEYIILKSIPCFSSFAQYFRFFALVERSQKIIIWK